MMNKYQEALEFLRSENVTAWGNDNFELLYFHLDNIEELVDKATPKKPINRINYRTDINAYYCPNCNGFICNYYDSDNERDDYCVRCGQAVDWSDEDVD